MKQLLADKRIRRTSESPPRFSVIDAIACATACDGNEAAGKFRRVQSVHRYLFARVGNFRFCGQGQKQTPVCEAAEFERLFAALPGKGAQLFRTTGKLPVQRTIKTRKDHLYIMRYSFSNTAVKIGRSGNVESMRKSL